MIFISQHLLQHVWRSEWSDVAGYARYAHLDPLVIFLCEIEFISNARYARLNMQIKVLTFEPFWPTVQSALESSFSFDALCAYLWSVLWNLLDVTMLSDWKAKMHQYYSVLWSSTVFENHPECRIWIFQFWHFPPNFVLLKLTCMVTLFDRKLQVFKNSPKWSIFN